MCCFPVKDIEYEAAPRYRNVQAGYRYQWNGQSWDLQRIEVPVVAFRFKEGVGETTVKIKLNLSINLHLNLPQSFIVHLALKTSIAPSMAGKEVSRPSGYLGDSESSGRSESSLPSSETKRTQHAVRAPKSRRVTIRTPSEEDLFERRLESGRRRPPTPYSHTRYPSSDEEDCKTPQSDDHLKPKSAPPEIPPSDAPAGTAPQNGHNQVHTHYHLSQPSYLPGQSFINTPQTTINTLQPYATYYPNQQAPTFHATGATMDGYQNAFPANNGMNFQPQVPDTSLGPMNHIYRPTFDGGVYVAQPGIAPPRPITFAQAPLVAMPAAAPAVTVCPGYIASAPVCTTLGYVGDDGIIAPREVVVGPQGVAVPLQAGPATAPIMPIVTQQPYQPQPMMVASGIQPSQPVMMAAPGGGGIGVPPGQPILVHGGPAPMGQPTFMMPGNNSFQPLHNEPATGIGQTASQVAASYMANPELNQPQDFKPADENPSRMYMVRQLDGQFIQMPRITIDSFGKAARWYVTDDGVFYAVRLEE